MFLRQCLKTQILCTSPSVKRFLEVSYDMFKTIPRGARRGSVPSPHTPSLHFFTPFLATSEDGTELMSIGFPAQFWLQQFKISIRLCQFESTNTLSLWHVSCEISGWTSLSTISYCCKKTRLVFIQTIAFAIFVVCLVGDGNSKVRSGMSIATKNQSHGRRTSRTPLAHSLSENVS